MWFNNMGDIMIMLAIDEKVGPLVLSCNITPPKCFSLHWI